MLQDALELVVIGALVEIGVDEQKNLESKSFDELVGELKKAGVNIPKTGTIKALNKQRVISKHYGQLAEPATVVNYGETGLKCINEILTQVVAKTLDEIFLTELLPEGESKDLLNSAIRELNHKNYLECLILVRKAFYLEYESEYAIHRWGDVNKNEPDNWLLGLGKGGLKAPYWKRNSEWIIENVKNPTDYVQVEYEKLRLDALEWGVITSEIENLLRMTPSVFRADSQTEWCIAYDLHFPPNEASLDNCNYCLDKAIAILLKKKEHQVLRRYPSRTLASEPKQIYIGHNLYISANSASHVVHTVQEGYLYTMNRLVSGFNPAEMFYYVSANRPATEEHPHGSDFVHGYLLVRD